MAYRQGYHLPLARVAVFLAAGGSGCAAAASARRALPGRSALEALAPGSRRRISRCARPRGGLTWRDVAGIGARRIRIDSTGELVSAGGAAGVAAIFYGLFFGFCLVWVLRQLLGYRRSSGDHRQQLKWLLAGGTVCLGGFVAHHRRDFGLGFVGILALPIGIGVGILRYRLYEIDRMISRTLSYALADRVARRRLRRARAADDAGAAVLLAGRRRRLDARGGRHCSARCAAACSGSSTAASTAPATTPRPPSPRSRPASATPSTSTPSSTSSPPPPAAASSPPTSPSGCDRNVPGTLAS